MPPTGISQILTSPHATTAIFTLDGKPLSGIRSLNQLPQGIYLINGKKVMVK
jgi:hypothetical protein